MVYGISIYINFLPPDSVINIKDENEMDMDIYDESSGLLEDDELDAAEEGFMKGYEADFEE